MAKGELERIRENQDYKIHSLANALLPAVEALYTANGYTHGEFFKMSPFAKRAAENGLDLLREMGYEVPGR